MAKLGAFYGLCPLIDQKSLLGVTEDQEKDVVIVTLGQNIAVKYRLSDQKQLHSWRTKEKFTSPVVYDKQLSKNAAVFNQTYVRIWSSDEENIDKLKKYKFNHRIHTIFSYEDQTFIIFKNGNIRLLNDVLETRKELSLGDVLNDEENINDYLVARFNNDTFIGLIVAFKTEFFLKWTKCNRDSPSEFTTFKKIDIVRNSCDLTGYLFNTDDQSVNFYTLWSDGKMFACPLQSDQEETKTIGELFTVVETINSKHHTSVVPLNRNYFAMYGSDCNEEGAVLAIYNAQFKMTQTKQTFKMFTKGAKLWCINSNLILTVGQHLAVVPFQLDTEQLAGLLGSLKTIEPQEDPDVSIVQTLEEATWDSRGRLQERGAPPTLPNVAELIEQGLPECLIIEQVLSDVLEQQDVEKIAQVLTYFCDIPEKWLVKCLKFALNANSTVFGHVHKETPRALPLFPKERATLLNTVLSKPFSEILVLQVLRTVLDLDDVLFLLEYICFMLSKQLSALPGMSFLESEAKLIEWACILLDSNYQRFLLTKDEKVNELMINFSDFIKDEIDSLEDLRQVGVLLTELTQGKSIVKSKHVASLKYSIEQIHLY